MKRHFLLICIFLVLFCAGCTVKIKTPDGIGLNQATLDRIDKVNQTLAEGIDIGPETRQLIREINETLEMAINEGIGLNKETLATVDDLLRQIEDGITLKGEVGLDPETRGILEEFLNLLETAPDEWQGTLEGIIRTLEGSAGRVAGQMADDVEAIIDQAETDAEKFGSSVGTELRCNVDFFGRRVNTTINGLIGQSLIGRVRAIIRSEDPPPPAELPHICQIIPNYVRLVETGHGIVYDGVPLTITGYDFVDSNMPEVYVVNRKGVAYKEIEPIPTAFNTVYQFQLGLQEIDFSEITPGSKIVLDWENVGKHEILFWLPSLVEAPIANFECAPGCEGESPLDIDFVDKSANEPTDWLWEFGDETRSTLQNPPHTFEKPGKYVALLTVWNSIDSDFMPKTIKVYEKAEARFDCIPTCSGEAPFPVDFINTSVGHNLSQTWEFIERPTDGLDPFFSPGQVLSTTTEHDPQFIFTEPGNYEVALTVSSPWSSNSVTKTITVMDPPPEPAPLGAGVICTIGDRSLQGGATAFYPNCEDIPNLKVPTTVKISSTVSGGVQPVTTTWTINGGAPSEGPSLTHTFAEPGIYTVELKARDANGVEASKQFTLATNPLYFAEGEIVYLIYTNLGDDVYYTTNIPTSDWDCGIVGMEADGGNINAGEEDLAASRILVALMTENAGFWRIRADFSSRIPENWSRITVMCLKKTAFDRGGYYLFRGLDMSTNTEIVLDKDKTEQIPIDPAEYTCGIVGMLTGVGNINQHRVDRILQAYMEVAGNVWRINFDVASEGTPETHAVDVLCIKNDDQLFYYPNRFKSLGDEVSYDTGISAEEFFCGVTGMEARNGAIDSGTGINGMPFHMYRAPMLRAFSSPIGVGRWPNVQSGTWAIEVDLRSKDYTITKDLKPFKNPVCRGYFINLRNGWDIADHINHIESCDGEVSSQVLHEDWSVNLLCVRRPIIKPVSEDFFKKK